MARHMHQADHSNKEAELEGSDSDIEQILAMPSPEKVCDLYIVT
jgi:hypothetical protein